MASSLPRLFLLRPQHCQQLAGYARHHGNTGSSSAVGLLQWWLPSVLIWRHREPIHPAEYACCMHGNCLALFDFYTIPPHGLLHGPPVQRERLMSCEPISHLNASSVLVLPTTKVGIPALSLFFLVLPDSRVSLFRIVDLGSLHMSE